MATVPTSPTDSRPPRMNYDPRNWYWFVADDKTRAYSSKSGTYVPATDSTLKAWLNAGGRVTCIVSVDELNEVLVQRNLPPTPGE